MDDAAFRLTWDRIDKALVAILSCDLGPDVMTRLDVGSGVLVQLGGREIVFTAAHNVFVDGERKLEKWITVAGVHNMPNDLAVVMKPGGGTAGIYLPNEPDVRGLVDPDVAVLELGPNALLRRDRVPFDAEEIGFLPSDATGLVAIAGFPAASTKAPLHVGAAMPFALLWTGLMHGLTDESTAASLRRLADAPRNRTRCRRLAEGGEG